jgi:hypothetical protein
MERRSRMISSKDLNSDLRLLDLKLLKKQEITNADLLKAVMLQVKVLRDIRTNQVSWMKKEYGMEIFKKARRPRPKTEKPKKEEKK